MKELYYIYKWKIYYTDEIFHIQYKWKLHNVNEKY